MTTVATFTSNRGEFVFDAVKFGDNLIATGTITNKKQIRAMVSGLRQFYQLQTVTVTLCAGKLWVNVLARSGKAWAFNVGTRGKCSSPCLIS